MSKLVKISKSLLFPRRSFSNTSSNLLKDGDSASLVRRITCEDLKVFGDLVGDHNPVHFRDDGDSRGVVVHGTLLLGIVSGLMASTLPGPGTVLTSLTANFVKPCPCPTTVEVRVVLGRVRRVTKAAFTVENMEKGEVVVEGEVSCFLSKEQLQLSKG
eukprot:GFUD01021083.1.p2 GENE.GFUD01021083.1~~GFUD01021083.1.p2  ORF type:complete len:158 (+),score=56.13 GFUD01021083.1:56-529(+)